MENKIGMVLGATGQDGSYLIEHLLSLGYIVHGIVRRSSTFNTARIDHLYNNPDIFGKTFFTHYGDVTDPCSLNELVKKIQPDEVYNLAAMSHVAVSFMMPQFCGQVDAIGTLNVLEAVRQNCPHAKVYQASTSELYGGLGYNMPSAGYTEESPFHPRSPYSVAKIYGYWICRNYREAYNMFISNGILFNHCSPRRGETFVTRKITLWFADFCYRLQNNMQIIPLSIGNLSAFRDFGHAKDYIIAQHLILQQDQPDDYVIATGEAHSVKDFIEECFHLKGWQLYWSGFGDSEHATCNGQVVVQVNPKYYRPSEVPYLLGDSTKARQILGWTPKYDFKTLVKEMVESDLENKGLTL